CSQLIHLAAASLGLGAQWVTIHIPEAFSKVLDTPDLLTFYLIIPLGWPAVERRPGWRRELDEIVHHDGYDRSLYMSDEDAYNYLRRLRVVDLDGARAGAPAHLAVLQAIAAAVNVPIEFGGGIRSREAAEAALAAGAERVIVGTAAIEDPALARALAAALGAGLVLGVDARDGLVATRGWLSGS